MDGISKLLSVVVHFYQNMGNKLKTGDLVEVRDYRGSLLLRKAVEISVDTVYICTPEEWELASKERREPVCVGFHKEFVNGPVAALSE